MVDINKEEITTPRVEDDLLGSKPGEVKLTTDAPVEVASKPETGMSDSNERLSNRYSATRDVDAQNLRDRSFSESDVELEVAKKSKVDREAKQVEDQEIASQGSRDKEALDAEIVELQSKIDFIESEGNSSAASRDKLNILLAKKDELYPPQVEVQDSITDSIENVTADKQHLEESGAADAILAANSEEVEFKKEEVQAKKQEDSINHARNKERTTWQKELDEQREAINEAKERLNSDDLKIKAESKETFWGSLSVPEKIIAGISLFLGAAGSGGRNFAAQDFNDKVKQFAKAKGKSNEDALLQRKHAYERINLELDMMSKMINNKDKLDKLQILKDNNKMEAQKASKERESLMLKNWMKDKLLTGERKLKDMSSEEISMVLGKEEKKDAFALAAAYDKETEKLGTRGVINSYRDVVSMAQKGANGKTDIALLTKFMKTLDPGSVVREGEFHIAADASPALRSVVTKMKGLVTGEKLHPTDRKEFARAVAKLLKPKLRTQEEINKKYKDKSRQFALPHSLIVEDFSLEKVSKKTAIIEMQKKRFPNKSEAQIERAVDKLFPNID